MKVYTIVDSSHVPSAVMALWFSTYDRAEQDLSDTYDGDLHEAEAAGYYIQELEVSDAQYFELVAREAEEDIEQDDSLSTGL